MVARRVYGWYNQAVSRVDASKAWCLAWVTIPALLHSLLHRMESGYVLQGTQTASVGGAW